MKIAIVSKADATGGGASRVAADLAKVITKRGHKAQHFAFRSAVGFSEELQPINGGPFIRTAIGRAYELAERTGFPDLIPFELLSTTTALREFDVVHFHDLTSAFNPITVAAIAKNKPTAWTIHDCSPFTGGCLYPQMTACQRYKVGCGDCSQLNTWPLSPRFDTTAWGWKLKKFLHKSGRVRLITPSQWMRQQAVESGLVKHEPLVISNMVDVDQFRPSEDRTSLRKRFGLPLDRPVLAFSSGSLDDHRKGLAEAVEALNLISHLNPFVVVIGRPAADLSKYFKNIDYVATGYVTNRTVLSRWLSAADAFLFPSKADNQPLSIMEAMACGTPVYGFPTGGAAEMIVNGLSGKLTDAPSSAALARILEEDIVSGGIGRLRETTREHAVSHFDEHTFAEAHLSLYYSMAGIDR